MALKILIPLPKTGFDPTETGIPWCKLVEEGHQVTVATPDGQMAEVDERVRRGNDLKFAKGILMADYRGRTAFEEFESSEEFENPISYADITPFEYDGLSLPGGHAPGMKAYLESPYLQKIVAWMMDVNRPVGAICHGVVLAARSRSSQTGKSVLFGRRTTALALAPSSGIRLTT
jgi:putative intracellular protease/amidase